MNKKNILTSEKGSVTVYVLVTMLFFSVFIMGTYIINSRKYNSQLEANAEIKAIYEKNDSNTLFSEHFAEDDDLIPIYTTTQLAKIGSGAKVYVAQEKKIYTYSDIEGKYKLMNNMRNTITTAKLTKYVSNYGPESGNYSVSNSYIQLNE